MVRDESVGELYRQLDPADMLYDYLIGSTIGLFGSGADIAAGRNAEANRALRDLDANEAAYLRRMEEIGHLRPEGGKNAALDGAAEDVQEDITEQKSGGLQRTEKSDIMSFRMAETGGWRNETPLTSDQIAAAEQMARSQGYEGDIAYSEHENTAFIGFSDGTRLLIIGTDAYPSETPCTANEALPIKAAIAHETVGHYEAWLRGSVKENRVLDEVQASVRAARFAADLTIEERDALMQDAFFRLKKANLSFEEIKDQLDIEER